MSKLRFIYTYARFRLRSMTRDPSGIPTVVNVWYKCPCSYLNSSFSLGYERLLGNTIAANLTELSCHYPRYEDSTLVSKMRGLRYFFLHQKCSLLVDDLALRRSLYILIVNLSN
jgi:hypothetical protein